MRLLASAASALAVFVVGCDGEPLAELVPDIAVAPAEFDFGTVQPGVLHDGAVDVGNRGTGSLTLRSVRVEPADSAFAVAAAPNRVTSGNRVTLDLSVLLNGPGPQTANLVIESDDEDSPVVTVPLTAEGGVAHLVVDPDPVDLGVVNEGPGASRAVTLLNDGLDNLTVTGGAFVDDVGFEVAAALPVNLGPDETAVVTVSLQPDAALLAAHGRDLSDVLRLSTSIGDRDVAVTASINLAPIAVAVERDSRRSLVKVGINDPVVADGSDTVDPEGDAFTYSWSVAERPAGSIAAIIGQGQPQVRVTPDVVGAYVVRLRATDVKGAFGEADLQLLPRDLAAVLTWGASGSAACLAFTPEQCDAFSPSERAQKCCGQSDLDLHLVGPRGVVDGVLGDSGACPGTCENVDFCSEESDAHVDTCRSQGLDCSFANRFPDWGDVGRADDPRLDIDDVSGLGPEVISLNEPKDGIYRVIVHYCLDRIDEPSEATVTLFEEGVPLVVAGPQTVVEGEAWIAAILERSNGEWRSVITPPGIFETNVPVDLCSR